MVAMTGRGTMGGRARWAGTGGRSRTSQRLFAPLSPWGRRLGVVFPHPLSFPEALSLVAGAEGVVTKAGKPTYGLDRFFSSWYGQPVPGLAFVTLSLGSGPAQRALPRRGAPGVRSEAEQAARKAKAAAKTPAAPAATRRRGRPQGSTNTPPAHVPLPPALMRLTAMRDALLPLMTRGVSLTDLVLDGPWGHHHARQMARQSNLPRIAKLRCAAALYSPDTGPDAGRGPRRKYGPTVEDEPIPGQSLHEPPVEGRSEPRLSQAQLLQKEFAPPLPVVIIVKTTRPAPARAPVVLFSRDCALPSTPLGDDYGLRFQLEWTFRDAKQYWGLEDFMHVTPTGGPKAANLALCLGHGTYRLRAAIHPRDPASRLLDLKADWRGFNYVEETIPRLPEKPAPVLLAKILNQGAGLGRIHVSQPTFSFS